ncbi:hypothetical protein ES703_118673 [subsurface metagenome]
MDIDPARQPRKLRDLIGVQLQRSGLPGTIRVDEAMKLFCAYHGVAPRYDLLNRLGLTEKRSAQYHQLSAGQQRRLALALAVAHNPPVLFLDEPNAGLDVPSRVELHNLMRELRAEGTTIVPGHARYGRSGRDNGPRGDSAAWQDRRNRQSP